MSYTNFNHILSDSEYVPSYGAPYAMKAQPSFLPKYNREGYGLRSSTPLGPSRVERLRAELEVAEMEAAAFERQRRFEEIKEEERLRALARQQILEEAREEARLEAVLALHRRRQREVDVLTFSNQQHQVEERKRALYERALQAERLRLRQIGHQTVLQTSEIDQPLPSLQCRPGGSCDSNPLSSCATKFDTGASFLPQIAASQPPVQAFKQTGTFRVPQAHAPALNNKGKNRTPQANAPEPKKEETLQPNFEDIMRVLGLFHKMEKIDEMASQSSPKEPKHNPTLSSAKVPAPVESRPDLKILETREVQAKETEAPNAASSLDTVNKISTTFDTLVSEFTFPSNLDFTPSPSRNPSPSNDASPDGEQLSSISKLAYTPTNAPLRVFENAALKLLNELDSVESHGDAEIRKERKQVAEKIEHKMVEVEREVTAKWRGWNQGKEEVQVKDVQPSQALSNVVHEGVSFVNVSELETQQELSSLANEGSSALPATTNVTENRAASADILLDEPLEESRPSSSNVDSPTNDPTSPFSSNDEHIVLLSQSVEDLAETLHPVEAIPSDSEIEPFLSSIALQEADNLKKNEKGDDEDSASDWSEVDA